MTDHAIATAIQKLTKDSNLQGIMYLDIKERQEDFKAADAKGQVEVTIFLKHLLETAKSKARKEDSSQIVTNKLAGHPGLDGMVDGFTQKPSPGVHRSLEEGHIPEQLRDGVMDAVIPIADRAWNRPEGLREPEKTAHEVLALAKSRATPTMRRNLEIFELLQQDDTQRLSREAIAVKYNVQVNTLDVLKHRAEKELEKIAVEMRDRLYLPNRLDGELEPISKKIEKGELQLAKKMLFKLSPRYDEDPLFWSLLAILAARLKKFRLAIKFARRGLCYIDLNPEPYLIMASLLNAWSIAEYELGNHEKAHHIMKRAHTLDPKNPKYIKSLLTGAYEFQAWEEVKLYIRRMKEVFPYLSPDDQQLYGDRLKDSKDLVGLRQMDIWNGGPDRWIRKRGRHCNGTSSTKLLLVVGFFLAGLIGVFLGNKVKACDGNIAATYRWSNPGASAVTRLSVPTTYSRDLWRAKQQPSADLFAVTSRDLGPLRSRDLDATDRLA